MTLNDLKKARFLTGPRVRNLVVIDGTLTTQVPLHLGSGESVGIRQQVDNDRGETEVTESNNLKALLLEVPQARTTSSGVAPDRDKEGWPLPNCPPFIPGSSIKGVLRAWCESLLAPWGDQVASINGEDRLNTRDIEGALRRKRSELPADVEPPVGFADRVRSEYLLERIDLVSGIFGTGRWRGKVEVGPARIKLDDGVDARSFVSRLPRVAIDPVLGTAEDRKLFFVEVVRPQTRFHLQIRLRNLRAWELGLVALALESFNDAFFPTRVGAHTQQGLGQVGWKVEGCRMVGDVDGKTAGKDVVAAFARQRIEEERPPRRDEWPGRYKDWLVAFEEILPILDAAAPDAAAPDAAAPDAAAPDAAAPDDGAGE